MSLKHFIVSKSKEVLKKKRHCKNDTGASLKGSQSDSVIINTNIAVMDENPLNKKLLFIIECYIINVEGKKIGKKKFTILQPP